MLDKIIGNNISWMKDNSFKRVIFLTRHGSMAYGTNTPESDEDFRGICIPPKEYYLGFLNKFEHLVKSDPDTQIFEIKKFLNLAYQNNPNVLEILFTDESEHIHITPSGRELLDHRDEFISKAAKARFLGYASQQLHRIKTHRRWLLNPPQGKPNRVDYGLPDKPIINKQHKEVIYSQIKKKIDEWNLDFEPFSESQKIYLNDKVADVLSEMQITNLSTWEAAARTLGLEENFIKLLIDEKSFDSRITDWENYQNWKKKRNPVRAALEAKYLYDTKHGCQLIRLLRMGKEILTEGKVIVKRPDFKELLEIKNGSWTYEQLIEYAENLEKEVNISYEKSTLRKMPDANKIDKLCQKIITDNL